MTDEPAIEVEEDPDEPSFAEYVFLDVMEGGSSTVILDEKSMKERGIAAIHICGGCIYALLSSDWKLHKLEEVKGMPASANVRPIRAAKPE
jgi:hypothetical protein